MNLSLRMRVIISFVLANAVIIMLGVIVFQYLNSLNRDMETISNSSNQAQILTDDIRVTTVSILKYHRKLLTGPTRPQIIEKLLEETTLLLSQLQKIDAIYTWRDPSQNAGLKEITGRMKELGDQLKMMLLKSTFNQRDPNGAYYVEVTVDKLLDTFVEFQEIQYINNDERKRQMESIIAATKKKMMYTLIITIVACMVLALIIPGKIALPFKKINDAIRELQDCNFDVSISYNRDDEIGEMAIEINKMIRNLKIFEELRADRILIEGRKFDALASMVKKYILVANAEGRLIYMNSRLYSLLQLQSDDILAKNMKDTLIPEAIITVYELAIKRRSKIENAEITIPLQRHQQAHLNDLGDSEDLRHETNKEETTFQGYANVIPIRGKESSLDYYLMIFSEEIFV